jgi:hypothetical protein
VSDIKQRAADARSLMDNAVFQAILSEILEDAVSAFKRPTATPADLEAAHEDVRHVEKIKNKLQSRIDAEKFADKKAVQHRGND